ncbi:MAG: hypothetical protein DCF30_19435 [Hyphomicrobiales bacterium]|nr:MAG: hypothetical protein DCF30_19435 [Hyphomicrobiales bacterium]
MLEVSSVGITVMMLTLVGIVAVGLDQLNSFNGRTDGQFQQHATGGGYQSIHSGGRPEPLYRFLKRLFKKRHKRASRRLSFPDIRSTGCK